MAWRLVADIGGTNARLGLARHGVLSVQSIRSFRNDDFGSYEELARTYLGQTRPEEIADVVIAIAGPTSGQTGRLTNRNWHFDTLSLADSFGGAKVALLNDLSALGYALPYLGDEQIETLVEGYSASNGQSLVVGIGTGFNVCPVKATAAGVICLEAETGHIGLPAPVWNALATVLGKDGVKRFETVEHVFSGRGFKALEKLFDTADTSLKPGTGFDRFYRGLLAQLVADLALAYLPNDGIYFAGGVARALFPVAGSGFDEFQGQTGLPIVENLTPVKMIVDDNAALYGCAGLNLRPDAP